MHTFSKWLKENEQQGQDPVVYTYANVKPASEWKKIWFNLGKDHLQKMLKGDEEDLAVSVGWFINQVGQALAKMDDKKLSAPRVSVIATKNGATTNPKIDSHIQQLVDKIEDVR